MRENLQLAWIASWFALVGQLGLFIVVAVITGDWRYIMWSLIVSMMAGVPAMIQTWRAQKRVNEQAALQDE